MSMVKSLRAALRKTSHAMVTFLKTSPYCVSLYEAVFVFVVSNFALVFLVFTSLVDHQDAAFSVAYATGVIEAALSSSEIFVYIMALLAPALWVMFYNWRARRNPIFYFALLGLQAVLILGSAYIYGRSKSGGVANEAFANRWAWIAFWAGLGVWYISMVYDKLFRPHSPEQPDSGQKILRELER